MKKPQESVLKLVSSKEVITFLSIILGLMIKGGFFSHENGEGSSFLQVCLGSGTKAQEE